VAALAPLECAAFKGMFGRRLNTPLCCSVGRLFDGVASLVNLRQKIQFEGQAAMELEFAAAAADTEAAYPIALVAGPAGAHVIDWAPLIEGILADVAAGVSPGAIAAKFHNTLAGVIVTVARRIGCGRVALSGGCFQNRYLTERTVHRLRTDGFQPYWHQRVPPNDGGIALGQVIAAQRHFQPAAADRRPLPTSSPATAATTPPLLQTTN
jgi:hydrogenase maturation protein HypF